jgi:hypothetical protein
MDVETGLQDANATRSPRLSPSDAMSSVSGASDSSSNAWAASPNAHARIGPGLFPPELVVQINKPRKASAFLEV